MAKEEENMELSFPEIFDILDCSMEDMLDVLSQAIDMLEEGKNEDALEVLKALEEDMFDFLGYVDEGELEGCDVEQVEVVEEKPKKAAKPAVKPAAKAAPKPAAKPAAKKAKSKK
ncbi:MAG: hypothetical protein ABR986_05100 [Methanomassiliicoccales archaeon]|jgi:hypothetical protein